VIFADVFVLIFFILIILGCYRKISSKNTAMGSIISEERQNDKVGKQADVVSFTFSITCVG
jgi:hypothetical protein